MTRAKTQAKARKIVVNTLLDQDAVTQLDEISEERGIPRSVIIRQAISAWIKQAVADAKAAGYTVAPGLKEAAPTILDRRPTAVCPKCGVKTVMKEVAAPMTSAAVDAKEQEATA